MKRIAIDMDEVIADFNSKLIPGFNSRFNTQINLADLEGLTIQQLHPEFREQVEEMIGEVGFFTNLDVIPHSQRVIKPMRFSSLRRRWNFRCRLMPGSNGWPNISPSSVQ